MAANGQPGVTAVAAGILAGVACGIANGALVGVLGLPSVTITLGSMAAITSITLLISDYPIRFVEDLVDALSWDNAGFVEIGAALVAGVVLTAVVLALPGSGPGGAPGPTTARPGTPAVAMLSHVVAGTLAAVAGILLLGRVQAFDPGMGSEYLVPAAAAAVVGGGGLLCGDALSIAGAAFGAILVAALTNELLLAGVSQFWQQLAIGIVIVVGLVLDRVARLVLPDAHLPGRRKDQYYA